MEVLLSTTLCFLRHRSSGLRLEPISEKHEAIQDCEMKLVLQSQGSSATFR